MVGNEILLITIRRKGKVILKNGNGMEMEITFWK